jgi:hypothetical protein
LYLVADVSKTNPYLNEPAIVVYKSYFANTITNLKSKPQHFESKHWNKTMVAQEGVFKGQNLGILF